MVKLYRFDEELNQWVFVDYGVRNKADLYTSQGFIVVY